MDDKDIDLSDIPELSEKEHLRAKPFRQFLQERGVDYTAIAPSILVTYHEDGSTSTHQLAPEGNVVVLDPDVQHYFRDSASVNRTLRALIQLLPQAQ